MKTFVLRFDIDSIFDLTEGVPAVSAILKRTQSKAVFFVNMGRQFSLWDGLIKSPFLGISRTLHPQKPSLGLLQKFGFGRLAYMSMINPVLGNSDGRIKILKELADEGHEIGLHGGANHTQWLRNIDKMNSDQIEAFIAPALNRFVELFGKPVGFASPGFMSNPLVEFWLSQNDFKYSVDKCGAECSLQIDNSPASFPVTISGPQGVPYIEYCDHKRLDDSTIISDFFSQIESKTYACMYGHPFYEGKIRGDILEKLIESAYDAGFTFLTPTEILKPRNVL